MKQIKKILASVVFASLLVIYFLPNWHYKFKVWWNKRKMDMVVSKCPFPEKQGVNICCYENGKWGLCNEKEAFKCGEKIEVRIKLDNIDTPSYVCIREGFHPPLPIKPTDWTILYEDSLLTCVVNTKPKPDVLVPITRLPADFFLGGIIYKTTGHKKLVEILTFPVKNYSTIKDLLADLKNSKTVLEVEKEIICQ